MRVHDAWNFQTRFYVVKNLTRSECVKMCSFHDLVFVRFFTGFLSRFGPTTDSIVSVWL